MLQYMYWHVMICSELLDYLSFQIVASFCGQCSKYFLIAILNIIVSQYHPTVHWKLGHWKLFLLSSCTLYLLSIWKPFGLWLEFGGQIRYWCYEMLCSCSFSNMMVKCLVPLSGESLFHPHYLTYMLSLITGHRVAFLQEFTIPNGDVPGHITRWYKASFEPSLNQDTLPHQAQTQENSLRLQTC